MEDNFSSPERLARRLHVQANVLVTVVAAAFLLAGCALPPIALAIACVAAYAFRSQLRVLVANVAASPAMRRFALASVLLFACAAVSPAQDLANLYLAGGSYSAGASPAFAGSALYAHSLNASTGTYAFTAIDALPATTKPFTVTTNIGAGIAQKVFTIGTIPIFSPTSAGISYSGQNAGWAWSTGAGALFRVKPTSDGGGFYVMPTVRVLKSSISDGSGYQPIVGVLFGWGK